MKTGLIRALFALSCLAMLGSVADARIQRVYTIEEAIIPDYDENGNEDFSEPNDALLKAFVNTRQNRALVFVRSLVSNEARRFLFFRNSSVGEIFEIDGTLGEIQSNRVIVSPSGLFSGIFRVQILDQPHIGITE